MATGTKLLVGFTVQQPKRQCIDLVSQCPSGDKLRLEATTDSERRLACIIEMVRKHVETMRDACM